MTSPAKVTRRVAEELHYECIECGWLWPSECVCEYGGVPRQCLPPRAPAPEAEAEIEAGDRVGAAERAKGG